MTPETAARLEALTRAFYDQHAVEFDVHRQRPWPGWERVLEGLPDPEGRLRVLDAGCGNGRFGVRLAKREGQVEYLGLDTSEKLILAARVRVRANKDRRGLVDVMLAQSDVMSADLPRLGPCDLVVAFGLVHHVPSFERRARLMSHLASAVGPQGRLAVTFWRFGDRARFADRVVAWEDYKAASGDPLDLDDLEPGDHLLSWGPSPGAVRYCHHADDDEIDALAAATGLEVADDFSDDGDSGDLNRYLVMQPRLQ